MLGVFPFLLMVGVLSFLFTNGPTLDKSAVSFPMLLQTIGICKPLAALGTSVRLRVRCKMNRRVSPQLIPANVAIAAVEAGKWLQAGIMGGKMALQLVAVSKSLAAFGTFMVPGTRVVDPD
jgi:hypothetical protein